MSLVCSLLLPALALAAPTFDAQPDGRGVVPAVTVGGQTFVADLAVALTAPGWNGTRGSQRSLKAADVRSSRQGDATVYEARLDHATWRTRLRLTVRPVPDGLRLEYELTPEVDVAVENLLLMGGVPVATHAGVTRHVTVAEDVRTGVLPKELNAPAYAFLGGQGCDWLALVGTDGRALRLQPEGLTLGMQDDRKFGSSVFAIHAVCGGARTLVAGEPVRFALTLTATTAEAVDQAARAAAQNTLAGLALTSRAALRAGAVKVDRERVGVFERVELTADLDATYDNPFDPDDIDVTAEVTGPAGAVQRVPGFFFVPFQVTERSGRERLRVAGPASWRVRYTPTVAGRHRVVVRVKDRSGTAACAPVSFEATPSERPGFVRTSAASPSYFRFDSGRSYFAVGLNVCWAGGATPIRDYTDWFAGLSGSGGNWARLWLANNEKGLEWMPPPTAKAGRGTYLGLGRYALDNSWRLDRIVEVAEQRGVQLMFCLGTYGELLAEAGYFNEGMWVSNPYNQANGGPCAKPTDFFTNPAARKLYQRRLRYLVARWGYSPNLFAWEFWNEYTAPAPWVKEMAAWLKANDPNRHLVSNTYGTPEVWRLPEVDFTMTHHYGDTGNVPDFSEQFAGSARAHRQFGKPYLVAEFGIDWRTSDSRYDPKGTARNLHNGLWSCLMSGSAGTGMLWYWDDYVGGKKLWGQFAPLARFAAGLDFARTRFEPLTGVLVRGRGDEPERFSDLDIAPGVGWGRAPGDVYTPRPDGKVEGGPVASTIGSPGRADPKELASSLTFHLELTQPGKFIARLGTVSSMAHLQILLDGQVVADEELKTGPMGQGPWKAARYQERWKMWQCDYDKPYEVAVPAGRHTVVLKNVAGDWLMFSGYRLTGYRSSRYPEVQVLGLRSERLAALWLRHEQSTWKTDLEGRQPPELRSLSVTVPGLANGSWRVEWWDTATGRATRSETVAATDGKLLLSVPSLLHDVAAVLRREG